MAIREELDGDVDGDTGQHIIVGGDLIAALSHTDEANARLIAAAPQLFDGLERAFLFICHNMPLGPTNDRTEAGKLIDSLRVPLAKARGGTPNDGSIPSDD